MKDIDGGINIAINDGIYNIVNNVTGFSLHSGTDKDGIISLLKEYSEKIYNTEEDECCWIYQYSRKTIEGFVVLDKAHSYGEDFARFLNELLETESDVYYIDIC